MWRFVNGFMILRLYLFHEEGNIEVIGCGNACATQNIKLKIIGDPIYLLKVFKRFRDVNPEMVPKRLTEYQAHSIALPVHEIEDKLPELKENPFKRRICEVFSHDGTGNLTFEDFLDMMSVFSESAPRDIKAWYAFRIYDLDDDMYIGREDLMEATRLLTGDSLQMTEREEIVASVLDEADVDGDGRLSFMDFEHVVVRAPDFMSTFHIRV